ncbi:DUF1810 domain-containing protein [Tistrella bauzanensis]|uniref:DUF1810 domain-containing protein n=1 Tax=Tistrella arctica TaxID=3133430 RepID=A0ABU9YK50_9PROT
MTTTGDPFDLARFKAAQAGVFDEALAELRCGRKRRHWMWFIFPQLRVLGRSPTARQYGLSGLGEARAYLADPVLGARLVAATQAVLAADAPSLHAIFGSPDDLKFRSCMTLFAHAGALIHGDRLVFRQALDRWCGGVMDPLTLDAIGEG